MTEGQDLLRENGCPHVIYSQITGKACSQTSDLGSKAFLLKAVVINVKIFVSSKIQAEPLLVSSSKYSFIVESDGVAWIPHRGLGEPVPIFNWELGK